jgi:translation initiation factor IF-2
MTSELSSSADFARKEYSNIEALNTLITAQVKVFTDNQQILEKSVVSYEQSLKEITSNLSDGLGIILKHHMSEAYSELNDSLKDNINAITVSNAQVLHKLDVLLDELYKQSNK